jgi:hypothetical protein
MTPESKKKFFRAAATVALVSGSCIILAVLAVVAVFVIVVTLLFACCCEVHDFVKSFGKSGGTNAGSDGRAHGAGVREDSALPGETWLYGYTERQSRTLQTRLEKGNGPAADAPPPRKGPNERKEWLQ